MSIFVGLPGPSRKDHKGGSSIFGARDSNHMVVTGREQSLYQSFDVPLCLDSGVSACTSCTPVSLFSTTGCVFPSHPVALVISMKGLCCCIFRPKRGTYGVRSQKSCNYARKARWTIAGRRVCWNAIAGRRVCWNALDVNL